jgi:hypothetical protein
MPKAQCKCKARPKKPKKAQNGGNFMDFLKGANKFLKDSKLISGIASVASAIPGLSAVAAPIAGISGSLGYGKKPKKKMPKRTQRGKGLNQPGGSLMLAGQRQVNQRTPIR